MKDLVLGLGLTLALGALFGCAGDSNVAPPQPQASAPHEISAPAEKTAASAGEGLHAQGKVVPGSHEDWCGEHQVAESLCTRCNPELIAAFKATGDWCPEHGLPESQCKVCHPDLKIERPPKTTVD